jgi:hypothetical protein
MFMAAQADPGSEARAFADALPPQWDLQRSFDYPGDSLVARGRELWNMIAPDGTFRGQLLLGSATPEAGHTGDGA